MTRFRQAAAVRVLPFVTALTAATLSHSSSAFADDAIAQCIAASDKGIDLRKQGKLLEARSSLAGCAAPACGVDIKASCERRMSEITAALPTIIFVPKNGAGDDLAGVRVTMDGAILAEGLDGRPLTIDPGRHSFRFQASGQPPVEKEFVLNQSEKDRRETIVIGAVAGVPIPVRGSVSPAPLAPSSSPLKTAGYVVGAVGFAGIVVGTIFGIEAISNNNSAGCDSNSYCTNPQARTAAQGDATPSTIGFVAGGALLAGGVVMVLVARKHRVADTTGRWEAAPMMGGGGAGILVRGSW